MACGPPLDDISGVTSHGSSHVHGGEVVAAAATDPSVRYRIDGADCFMEVGGAWDRFAAQNEGVELAGESVLGRSLWDYVGDLTTRQLYRTILRHVRSDGRPVRFRFRCDGPTVRRLLAMEVALADSGHVAFTVTPLAEVERPRVPLLDVAHKVSRGGDLVMCGWCQDVQLPGPRWVRAEQAVAALGLFEGAAMPRVSHGICPACHDELTGALLDPGIAESGSVSLGDLRTG